EQRAIEHEEQRERDRDDKAQRSPDERIETERPYGHRYPPRASLRGGRKDLRSGCPGKLSSRKMRRRSGWPSNSMPNMSYVSRSHQFAAVQTPERVGIWGSSSVQSVRSMTKTRVVVPRTKVTERSSIPVSTPAFTEYRSHFVRGSSRKNVATATRFSRSTSTTSMSWRTLTLAVLPSFSAAYARIKGRSIVGRGAVSTNSERPSSTRSRGRRRG